MKMKLRRGFGKRLMLDEDPVDLIAYAVRSYLTASFALTTYKKRRKELG